MDGIDIRALANLIKPAFEGESYDENITKSDTQTLLGPGSIGPPKKAIISQTSVGLSAYEPIKKSADTKDIWDPNEISDATVEVQDNRKEPVFEIKYKQAVTTEDVFLQLGAKTPASFSCEDLVISIHLPNEELSSLNLSVTCKQLDLRGLHHKLLLPLPDPVDPDKENAKWDSETSVLTVTLRLNREMDMVNM